MTCCRDHLSHLHCNRLCPCLKTCRRLDHRDWPHNSRRDNLGLCTCGVFGLGDRPFLDNCLWDNDRLDILHCLRTNVVDSRRDCAGGALILMTRELTRRGRYDRRGRQRWGRSWVTCTEWEHPSRSATVGGRGCGFAFCALGTLDRLTAFALALFWRG